jgi:hypothetical protein
MLWTVLIRAYRWQQWKGKQNEILDNLNWRKRQLSQIFWIDKIEIAFNIWVTHREVIIACLNYCQDTSVWNLYTFSVAQSILYDNSKKYAVPS